VLRIRIYFLVYIFFNPVAGTGSFVNIASPRHRSLYDWFYFKKAVEAYTLFHTIVPILSSMPKTFDFKLGRGVKSKTNLKRFIEKRSKLISVQI